ncbi:MAG: hypothetical protein QOF85_174, partial [Solirubrobacterales bacterium]|nr:hypothetical protein [Solirubrobacterales bacterium]
MTRGSLIALLAALSLLAVPAAAQADFGIVPGSARVTALNGDGTIDTQASSHPYSFTAHFDLKTEASGHTEGGEMRDVLIDLPPGFIGNPQAMPRCPRQEFEGGNPQCAPSTQVGVLQATLPGFGQVTGPVYNLLPPPGIASQFGFSNLSLNSLQYASVRSEEGYGLGFLAPALPVEVTSVTETIWGVPADSDHDAQRGATAINGGPPVASDAPKLPFLTIPASCEGTFKTTVKVDSKQNPGDFTGEAVESLDTAGNPAPMTGCDGVPFAPRISSQPTTRLAENPSGLDFELKLANQGLLGPGAIAETEPKKTVVTLPEGFTVNPSLAEGIGVCSEAQYRDEKIDSPAGAGCPEGSKLGSVIAQSPLL